MGKSNQQLNLTVAEMVFTLVVAGGTALCAIELCQAIRLQRRTLEDAIKEKQARQKTFAEITKDIGEKIKEATGGAENKLDRCVTPTRGLDSMVSAADIKESLQSIVQYTNAHEVLFNEWGFDKIHRATKGIDALCSQDDFHSFGSPSEPLRSTLNVLYLL